MANIQNLQEKVIKAEEKVLKCKGTIERHEKQLHKKQDALAKRGVDISNLEAYKYADGRGSEFYSDICDIEWKQSDIKGATRKLNDAINIANNWKVKLDAELEKERFIESNAPQVIKDFLEEWKTLAFEWHINRYDEFIKLIKKLKKEAEEMKVEYVRKYQQDDIKHYMEKYNEEEEVAIQSVLRWSRLSGLDILLRENNLNYEGIAKRTRDFAGATVQQIATIRDKEERLEWLEKALEEEKKSKMIDLINRINSVVGTITDATNLDIKGGNLNGIIIGEKGKAKVETIGAGGYNIQCFHYRTLVNKL